MNRRAQSEMAGFAIIIIIVAVLILVFLSFSVKKDSGDVTESAEAENFVRAILQFTTDCEYRGHFLDYLDLIERCGDEGVCADGRTACDVLDPTSEEILDGSWKVGEDEVTKGYDFSVFYEGDELVGLSKGNVTRNSFGSRQVFSGDVEISFVEYN